MTRERKPVFFTSVPKCGKNLVYSFYFELGLKRWNWGDAPAVLHAAHFARLSDKQNYAFPEAGPITLAQERVVLDHVIGQLAAIQADTVAHHHFLPSPALTSYIARAGLSALFVKRDPRDALLSMLNFARKRALPAHVAEAIAPLSDEDALLLLLDGGGQFVPFADYFDAYCGWLSAPGVAQLCFEDLVGPLGGGDTQRQERACAVLATLAGFSPEDEAVKVASQKVFNVESGTFFKGQIGAWRDGFTPAVSRAYQRHAGWLTARWGYAEGAA